MVQNSDGMNKDWVPHGHPPQPTNNASSLMMTMLLLVLTTLFQVMDANQFPLLFAKIVGIKCTVLSVPLMDTLKVGLLTMVLDSKDTNTTAMDAAELSFYVTFPQLKPEDSTGEEDLPLKT